ncbi:MAG: PQQ-binding-like beta-propeller repeat protein [Planctomycetota bacterium]
MRLLAILTILAGSAVAQDAGQVALLTDEAISRYLSRGQELAKAGQWAKVVDVLQRVVRGDKAIFPDLEPDVLHAAVHSRDGFLYYPARELCVQELAKMPPEGITAYREAFDVEAKRAFVAAKGERDPHLRLLKLALVYDLYLISSYGDDALDMAAGLHLDLGRYSEALYLLGRLVELYPSDSDRDMPMVFARAAYCAARIGDGAARTRYLDRLSSEYPRATIRVEGKKVPAGGLGELDVFRVRTGGSTHGGTGNWAMPGGAASRARTSDDIPETIARKPFWSFTLAQREPRLHISDRIEIIDGAGHPVFDRWRVRHHDRAARAPGRMLGHAAIDPYPTGLALLDRGRVFYKDGANLLSRRIANGGLLSSPIGDTGEDERRFAQDPSYLVPSKGARPGSERSDALGAAMERAYRHLAYGICSVTLASQFMVTVEPEVTPAGLSRPIQPGKRHANRLAVYDRHTDKLIWDWSKQGYSEEVGDDQRLREEWQSELQKVHFRGPGIVSGGMIYTLVDNRDRDEKPAGVAVWALDLASGRVRFRTQLHRTDELVQQIPVDATLAVHGGTVYAATSGIVAAVDALPPGRIRWIRRYERSTEPAVAPRPRGRSGRPAPPARATSGVRQTFAINHPVVAGGRVIVVAPDAAEILALETETGRVAWRHKRAKLGDTLNYVVGVSGGRIVLAGTGVAAIEIADGSVAWRSARVPGRPYGRGIVGKQFAYLPTVDSDQRARIERYDITTGERAEPLQFEVAQLGNLVFAGGRLLVAGEERVHCFTDYQHEMESLQRRLQNEGDHADLYHERALLQITRGGGGREAARADFVRAMELAETDIDEGLAALVRYAAIDNLLAIALIRSDLAAVDEAERLARTRAYKAQSTLVRARVLSQAGKPRDSFDALIRLADEFQEVEVVLGGAPQEARVAAAIIREEMLRQDPRMRDEFQASVRARIARAVAKEDLNDLARIPALYGHRTPSDEAYLALEQIHRDKKENEKADLVLRRIIREFEESSIVPEAHLKLALSLARRGAKEEASAERDRGMGALGADQREKLKHVLAELDRLIPARVADTDLPRLSLPLRSAALPMDSALPFFVTGSAPAALADATLVVLPGGNIAALRTDGRPLWTSAPPAEPVRPAQADDPSTISVMAELARERLAVFDGEDLIVADAYGIRRLRGDDGTTRWTREDESASAMIEAAFKAMKAGPALTRTNNFPTYAFASGLLVQSHPKDGIHGIDAKSGDVTWRHAVPRRIPVGRPRIAGAMVLAGWAHPGLVRVYSLKGELIREHHVRSELNQRPGYLLFEPRLDDLGRLYLVTGWADRGLIDGFLSVVDPGTGKSQGFRGIPVRSANARVMHSGVGRLLFHDGGSGENLHVIETDSGKSARVSMPELLRVTETVQDGSRLFVLTHEPGRSEAGAVLLRLDLRSGGSLVYQHPAPALAYATPRLTRRHLVIASAESRRSGVHLYDRDADRQDSPPQNAFSVGGDKAESVLYVNPKGPERYEIPPSLGISGQGLLFSTPFGTVRLVPPGSK